MRRFLAIVLSILIGVQGILWFPNGMEARAEDVADNTNESGREEGIEEDTDRTKEQENTDEIGNAGGTQGQENTDEMGNTGGTQGPEGAAKEEEGMEENAGQAGGAGVEVSAPSAILMEASTGKIVYEKDADTRRPPASVTKIMTLLLIFDALADNRITLEDEVQTSEYAASMGGSQVFLEPGETQTVDTMIKCIAVASANDACAALKNGRQCNSLAQDFALCCKVRKKA